MLVGQDLLVARLRPAGVAGLAGGGLDGACWCSGRVTRLSDSETSVGGDHLAFEQHLERRPALEAARRAPAPSAHGAGRDAVGDALQAEVAVALHLAQQQLAGVEARHRPRRPQRADLAGVAVDGPLPGGSMHPDVGDAIEPGFELLIQLSHGGEAAAGEEGALEVLHARLHLALGLRPVRRARDGQRAVVLAEVQERAVELHRLAQGMPIDGGFHVVDQQLPGHPELFERPPEQRQQHRLLGAGGEAAPTACGSSPRRTRTRRVGADAVLDDRRRTRPSRVCAWRPGSVSKRSITRLTCSPFTSRQNSFTMVIPPR